MLINSGYKYNKEQPLNLRPYTLADYQAGKRPPYALDVHGCWRNIKVTSIKTWKRRPEIEVHWKYGLYEYGVTTITANGQTGVQLMIEE